MNDNADRELVERARAGDRAAFGLLVRRHQQAAMGVARRLVRDAETARELVQEALLEAYLSLERLREPERFGGWLCGIARHVCLNHLRAQKPAFSLAEELALRTKAAPDPQQLAEEHEERRQLRAAVDGLVPEQGEVVRLFYFERLSAKEVAARLGISVRAVNIRLHRARRLLGEILEPPEGLSAKRKQMRRIEMIEVKIADVIQRNGIAFVVLMEKEGNRFLTIQVGHWEGWSIAHGLVPMDQRYGDVTALGHTRQQKGDLIAELFGRTGLVVEEARIEVLDENVLLGVVKVRQGKKTHEVETRPSDVIALAVHAGSVVRVAEELMEQAGQVVPEESKDKPEQLFPGDKMLEKVGLTRGHFTDLERLHERFSRELAGVFSEAVGREVETDVAFVDQTTYGQLINALSKPSCTYAFSLEGLGGRGLMDISMPIVFGLLGLDERDPRALTEEERERIEPIARRLADGLEKMWAPLVPVAIEGLKLHQNPETIRLVAPEGHVGIYGFEVRAEGLTGLVGLCYPNALMVDPVLPRLELVG